MSLWDYSELYSHLYMNKYKDRSIYKRTKNFVKMPNARCENEHGRLQPGQNMPKRKPEKKQNKKSISPVPSYDTIGSQANMTANQMLMLPDGFDISLTNIIADNGNMAMGFHGDKYFSMKHQLSFDGPLGFLMAGGQRDYSVECMVQSGRNYTLVSNLVPSTGTLDGQWEHHWSKSLSSLFAFAVTSSDDPRIKMMLPNFSGKLSWSNTHHNLTFGKAQSPNWYLSTFHRLTSKLSLGSKLTILPESQETNLSFGGSYMIRGKTGEFEILEARISGKALSAFYTKTLSKHSTICTKFDLSFPQQTASSSFMYKYMFGSESNGTQILGEITSKFICRTIFMIPFVQRFMLRIHGEMNHFDFNPQKGQVPHKFGFQIQMEI